MLTSLHARECFLRLSSDGQLLPCVKARTLDIGEAQVGADITLETYDKPIETPQMPEKFVEQAASQAHPMLHGNTTALSIDETAKVPAPEIDAGINDAIATAQAANNLAAPAPEAVTTLPSATVPQSPAPNAPQTQQPSVNPLQAAMQHQATTPTTNTSYAVDQSHRGVNLHDVLASQSSKSKKKFSLRKGN